MSINVVLADDHTIVRDGLRALLEANPEIKVVGDAANGRQAVSQAKELQPDVVIMDISMPEMNGIDATRQILETCPQVRFSCPGARSTTHGHSTEQDWHTPLSCLFDLAVDNHGRAGHHQFKIILHIQAGIV